MAELTQSEALRFTIDQIPLDGMKIRVEETYSELAKELREPVDELLDTRFPHSLRLELDVFRVGSKVDVRGGYKTLVGGACDICGRSVELPLEVDISTFLMPESQFSDHDRPGGRVTHKPEREKSHSRHHSRSKAKELTGTPEDRAFEGFGAFDGLSVDLRPIVLESLVLNLPIQHHCPIECRPVAAQNAEGIPINLELAAALKDKVSIRGG